MNVQNVSFDEILIIFNVLSFEPCRTCLIFGAAEVSASSLLLPLNEHQRLSTLDGILHAAPFEMLIFEIKMVFFFIHLRHLAKPVHVKLSNEGFNLVMSEVDWQNLFLQLLLVLNQNFTVVLTPADDVFKLVFLYLLSDLTSRIV